MDRGAGPSLTEFADRYLAASGSVLRLELMPWQREFLERIERGDQLVLVSPGRRAARRWLAGVVTVWEAMREARVSVERVPGESPRVVGRIETRLGHRIYGIRRVLSGVPPTGYVEERMRGELLAALVRECA